MIVAVVMMVMMPIPPIIAMVMMVMVLSEPRSAIRSRIGSLRILVLEQG